MLTKTKIALAAVLLAGTATAATAHQTFRSAPARLQNEQMTSPNTSPVVNENNWYQTDVRDRASSPFAGGGGA